MNQSKPRPPETIRKPSPLEAAGKAASSEAARKAAPPEAPRKPLPPIPGSLPHPVVDSHCHLDTTAAISGLSPEQAIARAGEVGVTRIVQIGCDLAGARFAVDAANRWANIIAGVAIHPNDAARLADPSAASDPAGDRLAVALAEIEQLAQQPCVRAVGETGLDYFRTRESAGQQVQRAAFEWHIELAKRTAKTLVIHDRDAHADVLAVLDSVGSPERVVMHCFSGDAEFARACLDRGYWLSFAGPVTFKANEHLRDALRVTPLDRVLVETDAPFLTPVPHRGQSNASYLIPHTARFMSEVLKVELETLCVALDGNADVAFGGSWGDARVA